MHLPKPIDDRQQPPLLLSIDNISGPGGAETPPGLAGTYKEVPTMTTVSRTAAYEKGAECTTAQSTSGEVKVTEGSWVDEIDAAANNADAVQLEALIERHVWARWGAASNCACPPALLRMLAEDQAPLVRRAVAQNPNTPSEVLDRLRQDPDLRVRP